MPKLSRLRLEFVQSMWTSHILFIENKFTRVKPSPSANQVFYPCQYYIYSLTNRLDPQNTISYHCFNFSRCFFFPLHVRYVRLILDFFLIFEVLYVSRVHISTYIASMLREHYIVIVQSIQGKLPSPRILRSLILHNVGNIINCIPTFITICSYKLKTDQIF